jgi:hypothetical protein
MIKVRTKRLQIDWKRDALSKRTTPAQRIRRAAAWHARVRKAEGK